jgi:hypothetical protein
VQLNSIPEGTPIQRCPDLQNIKDALPKNIAEQKKKLILSLLGDVKTRDGQIGQLQA